MPAEAEVCDGVVGDPVHWHVWPGLPACSTGAGRCAYATWERSPPAERRVGAVDRALLELAQRTGQPLATRSANGPRLVYGQSISSASSVAPSSIRPLRFTGRYSPSPSPSQVTVRPAGSTIKISSTWWAA